MIHSLILVAGGHLFQRSNDNRAGLDRRRHLQDSAALYCQLEEQTVILACTE